jgi:hypothetical protein
MLFSPALQPGKVLSAADNLFLIHPWRSLEPSFVPSNKLLNDATYLFDPWLMYTAQELAHGRFPLWNPHIFAGAPFFANPQSALLFPLTWIVLLLPITLALTVIAILKVFLTGLAMYWFLRLRALKPVAALMGAVTFMLNGTLIAWLQWSYSSTLMFFPLLFGAVEYSRTREGTRSIALLALIAAVAVFAGYPQGTVLGLLAATAWALYRTPGGGMRFLARYALGIGLGLLLASVQLLPFIEYTWESAVFRYRSEWLPTLHASLRSAIAMLMPYYYGSPIRGDEWGEWNFNELSTSVGIVPWILLPVVLIAMWRRRDCAFFATMALGAASLFYGAGAILGVSTSVFVVGFRVASLLVFALSTLAALGADGLASSSAGSSGSAATAVRVGFLLLVSLALLSFVDDYGTLLRVSMAIPAPIQYLWFLALLTAAAMVTHRWLRSGGSGLGIALLGIQLVSLLPLAATYNPIIDTRLFYPLPPLLRWIQAEEARNPGRVLMTINLPMIYGLHGVAGYDGMTPRDIERAIRPDGAPINLVGNMPIVEPAVFFSPVRDLLGIRYVVTPPTVALQARELSLVYDAPDGRVYRNDAALPRTFVVSRARCGSDATILQLIRERAVDFRREVLLANCDEARAAEFPAGRSDAVIQHYSSTHILVRATLDQPGYLVLTDTWFPGWSARVDGTDVPLTRADYAFRAVHLPAGQHTVEFRYRPTSLRLGLAMSVVAAVAAAGLAWYPGRALRLG